MAYENYMAYRNYDKIYDERPDANWFFSDYPGNKLFVGTISLKNAKIRAAKKEYYTLVTYTEGEDLPEQYKPLPKEVFTSEDETLFATINPTRQFRLDDICVDGGIQMISNLSAPNSEDIEYLLGTGNGPGPETVLLSDLIMEQYAGYSKVKSAQTDSAKTQK